MIFFAGFFKQRNEFNEAMDLRANDKFGLIPQKEWENERDMLVEEIEEYDEACRNGDEVEVADAIGDIFYLAIGLARKHGLNSKKLGALVNEIHRSNMSKFDSTTGVAIKDDKGKVMKPESYFKPDLKSVILNFSE